MNPKLAIILIIIGAGMSGIVYASSTVISDTGIITPSITVSGTCSGCGATEGSFTHYNTIDLNTTSTGADSEFCKILVGNDESIMINGNTKDHYINPSGTTLISVKSYGCTAAVVWDVSQSSSGIYQTILNNTGVGSIQVYKNHVYLTSLGINQAQFSAGTFTNSFGTVGISPDGHYIVLAGQDAGGTSDRVIIFKGS